MRIAFYILLCLALSLSSAAFADDGFHAVFTDDAGQVITLGAKPERVAVLFSSLADMWISAGGEIAITVGESVERGFAGEDTPLVDAGAGKSVRLETLVSLKPDFVICTGDIPAQAKAAEILNDAGIPAARFRIDGFSDYLRVFSILCSVTGDAEAYNAYGSLVEKRVNALLSGRSAAGKRYLFVRAGSSASSVKAKTGSEHFVCAMLDELGLENIADDSPDIADNLSMEHILTRDPDLIFFTVMGDEQAGLAHIESMLSRPEWAHLSAVKNGKAVVLEPELFHYKPNARWATAYSRLIEIIESDGEGVSELGRGFSSESARKTAMPSAFLAVFGAKAFGKRARRKRATPARARLKRVFAVLASALLVSVAASLLLGGSGVSPKSLFYALTGAEGYETQRIILRSIRAPRTIAAVFAGAGLSLAGVLLQSAMGNPLASPNIIGVNAGAGFFVIVTLAFFPLLSPLLPLAAFLGALTATGLIVAVAGRFGRGKASVILAGIGCTALFQAGISLVGGAASDALSNYSAFSIGGLSGVRMGQLGLPCALISVSLALGLVLSRKIDALSLGDGMASSLGVRPARLRAVCLMLASLSAGAVVSFAGLLGFVGLIVPHMARKMVGEGTGKLLWASALAGATLVVLSDLAGRTCFYPGEVSVGVIMAFLGVPCFFALMRGGGGHA